VPLSVFSRFSLRGLSLDNRIAVAPMAQYSADVDGRATEWHLVHYGGLSVSGAGLIIAEATAVEARGRVSPRCLGLWSDAQVEALEPVVSFCRRYGGAKVGIQLAHSGRKGSVGVPWEKQLRLSEESGGWVTVGPSEVPYPRRSIPEPLDADGLAEVKAAYVSATLRAERLGFDLIELHCAHGYLLHSFLSPLSNFRTDAYGGGIENRMRFPLEVFQAIRAVWPEQKPLGVRISATDWAAGGWTLDDSVVFAKALRTVGCDYIVPSSGGSTPEQRIELATGYQVPFAARIRAEAKMPSMAVGLITDPAYADEIVATEKADLIALGRGMLYDPRWPWHAAEQLRSDAYFPPQYERSHPSMRRGDHHKPYRETLEGVS